MHNGENYATISKLHYRSETYAAALKKYNMANPGGQADYIRIPPVWVLKSATPATSAAFGQRTWPRRRALDTTRTQANVYIVPVNGEFLAEIAQKTLGDEDGWTRIKELNKNINEVNASQQELDSFCPPTLK